MILRSAALAVGFVVTLLVALAIQDWPSTETPVSVESTDWRPHEVVTPEYRAEERAEIVRTKAGSAFRQKVRLIEKRSGKTAAEFSIIRLYEKAFWKSGSATQLSVGPRRPVSITSELNSAHVRELVGSVKFVLCLGLASSSEGGAAEASGLSNRRANQLVEWLRYSELMAERDVELHPVPLGQARTAKKPDSREDREQRTALLIGVDIDNRLVGLVQALNELTPRIRSEVLRLDDYPGTLRPSA